MSNETRESKPVVHGGYVEPGQRWQYKPNRGTGSFTVVGVGRDRIRLRDWRGKDKRIGVNTLRGYCRGGAGGECHTPGCSLWINRAPDIPVEGITDLAEVLRALLAHDPDGLKAALSEMLLEPSAVNAAAHRVIIPTPLEWAQRTRRSAAWTYAQEALSAAVQALPSTNEEER